MTRTRESIQNTGWLHELARAEAHPEAEKLLGLSNSNDPTQKLEEATIEFLTELRDLFNEYAKIFNGLSEGGAKFADIKVYNLAQSAADFMVFRNGVKLTVANTAHGVIQMGYTQHIRGTLMVQGQTQTAVPVASRDATHPLHGQYHELLAQTGPFGDVFWTYQGERVTAEQVARYYFAEFTRTTRDTSRRSKAGNQVLLEQIKALLQEKGINL